MRIAIIHYHLERGGVSEVIAMASSVLASAGIAHVVLIGREIGDSVNRESIAPEFEGIPVRAVEGLGYQTEPEETTAEKLLEGMRSAAFASMGAAPDIWHFHNHSLGKNCLMADVVSLLASAGERMVLQIHDLAEHGRPSNYRLIREATHVYPVSNAVRYAFLNSRDRDVFLAAGLPSGHSITLPNSVERMAAEPAALDAPLLFAPIRGIRRKNIGELVLISSLAPMGAKVGISRAPANASAIPVHNQWEKFAARHSLPIGFDVVERFAPAAGAAPDFESWVRHATHIVSTSVSEGFGLPLFESISWGKPLLGRNLPHVAEDHGIHSSCLYDRILIPVDWIDATVLRSHLTTTLQRNYRAYSRQLTIENIDSIYFRLVQDDLVDFGNLPEALQQEIVERLVDPVSKLVPLVEISGHRRRMIEWLAETLEKRTPEVPPSVLDSLSAEIYRERLCAMYQGLMAGMPDGVNHIPAEKILSAFLNPDHFHFLLSELLPVGPGSRFKAVVFDIYGTLLIAPSGGVKVDPAADAKLRRTIEYLGFAAPDEPSREIHSAVVDAHAASGLDHAEVDLRVLWRKILAIPEGTDMDPLVMAIESAWHPSSPMPGAAAAVRKLARSGISLGLLSNAQVNTLPTLGDVAHLFAPELTVLSYQHGISKPDPALFQMMADRLQGREITPSEVLYIGNDPLQDIVPAACMGFKTALFIGHPESFRSGDCSPDWCLETWSDLGKILE